MDNITFNCFKRGGGGTASWEQAFSDVSLQELAGRSYKLAKSL